MRKSMAKMVFGLLLLALIACISTAGLANNTIDPGELVSFNGFGVNVAIDRPEYNSSSIMSPPVIRMALQVYNYSQLPVTFDFTTSQRYDFAIYDSVGREVWRWSDGKVFLPVEGQLILQPGESVVYTAEHRFANKTGQPMPTDLYTLKGELTAINKNLWVPRTMEGKVSFWHRRTP
ncbi:MAG TPA: hypothetical protein GXZ26_08200 [Firmicutes bacterium]|jgi:hypothetical protein|nr:hypothetical protein [Bacillota bacterium]